MAGLGPVALILGKICLQFLKVLKNFVHHFITRIELFGIKRAFSEVGQDFIDEAIYILLFVDIFDEHSLVTVETLKVFRVFEEVVYVQIVEFFDLDADAVH